MGNFFDIEASDSGSEDGDFKPSMMRKDEFYYGENELQQKNIPMNRVIDKIEEQAKHLEEKQIMREQKKLRRHHDAEDDANEAPID